MEKTEGRRTSFVTRRDERSGRQGAMDCLRPAAALLGLALAPLAPASSALAAPVPGSGSVLPFSVDPASGALAIVAGDERFETCTGLPAKEICREGEALRWTVEPEPGNVVTARFEKVSAREFRLTLSAPAEMKMTRPLAYPPAWRTAKGDTCIWPFGEGMAYPADDPSIEMQAAELPFANGQALSMGFYGFLRGGSCLMSGVAKTCDAALAVKCGEGLWSAAPKWKSELGRWAYDRELRFFLAPSLPAAAADYRAWRERRGEVRTFREKLGKNPALARFPGTADVWLWDDNTQCRLYNWPLKPNAPARDSVKIAREMKALGLDRVLWNSFEGETRESCAALKGLGYFVGTYDCLRDIFHPGLKAVADPKNFVMASRFLDCAEEIVRRNPDGSPATAWTIPDRAGKMHPMWSLCDAKGLEMVKRFVMPQVAAIGYDSRLMDVQVGNGPGICHAKDHPCTRRSGLEALREEHRFLCEEGGQVIGVEVGQEALLDCFHYSEGLTCCPHPFRKELCWRYKDRALYGDEVPEKTKTYLHNPARRIPLWELVYHDCTVSYYYWADSTLMYPELAETKDLFCALYGLPPIYSMNVSTWNELKAKVAESYRRATPVARRTMFSRMTDFAWLSPDRLLQRTTFANGVSVVANFSDEVRAGLAPHSSLMTEPSNGQDARSPLNAVAGGSNGNVVYVAPNGSDANPGTKDRPLATLAAARDAARRSGRAGTVVVLADGTYGLSAPLELDARDSGTTWRAANRGRAVVSGSVKPAASGSVAEPDVLALLPEAAREHVVFFEFPADVELPGFRGGGCGTPARLCEVPVSVFQGSRRLEPARWPNEGFARTGENVGAVERRHDASFCMSGVFRFADERLSLWAKEPDLWAYGLWCYEWADAKARVLKVDPAEGTLSVDPVPIGFGIRENAQFHVMNALSELDRPGEWVLDRRRRRLYVWPLAEGGELSFAGAPGLVRLEKAKEVVFDGLVFDCARTDAVVLRDCSACTVRASTVRRTSAWGVVVRGGDGNRVVGSDLYDLGEGGVLLEGGDFKALRAAGHVADNNHIHHYGKVVPNYKPGVQLNGVGNRATHNLIHHSRHQAIAFRGNDHYIGWNVIHDMCTFNDDAGSIYCCQRDWTKRGTVIERNVIHMTGKPDAPTHTEAIYLDDFSSGVTVRDNLINRASLGVYVGGGQDCVISGNVILNCNCGVKLGSRGIETFAKPISSKGRESGMFRRLDALRALLEGELWRSRYPNLLRVYDFEDGVFAHNALFNVITNNVCAGCGGGGLDNWQKVGPYTTVAGNLELPGDPGFADYAGFDWELRPDSPAAKLVGRTEFAKTGLYASPDRASPAVRFDASVTRPPEIRRRRAPAVVRIDFTLVGALPEGEPGFADGFRRCHLPDWGGGRRIVASYGLASKTGWTHHTLAFTPCFDCDVHLTTMGARGEDTLYDDIRVTGATIADGGFETGKGWLLPQANPKDYRAPLCNLDPPYGLVDAATAGVAPAEGRQMACGNDMLNFSTRLKLRKGVPVTVSFQARAAKPRLDDAPEPMLKSQ